MSGLEYPIFAEWLCARVTSIKSWTSQFCKNLQALINASNVDSKNIGFDLSYNFFSFNRHPVSKSTRLKVDILSRMYLVTPILHLVVLLENWLIERTILSHYLQHNILLLFLLNGLIMENDSLNYISGRKHRMNIDDGVCRFSHKIFVSVFSLGSFEMIRRTYLSKWIFRNNFPVHRYHLEHKYIRII